MTNEQIAEEILHEAHEKKFINDLRKIMEELKFQDPNLSTHDRVYKAYFILKPSIITRF